MKKLPDTDTLKELLEYEPDTGLVRWKVSSGGRKKGNIVGSYNSTGYRKAKVLGTYYLLHRLIWKLQTGEDPYGMEIDHIDRNPSNNKWNNLRLVDSSGNNYNQKKKHNSTGYTGVHKRRNKYSARIKHKGKNLYLGLFTTPEEASRAYETKKKELLA